MVRRLAITWLADDVVVVDGCCWCESGIGYIVGNSQPRQFDRLFEILFSNKYNYSGGLNTQHIGIPNLLKFGASMIQFWNGRS